jgi:hypothetical protein
MYSLGIPKSAEAQIHHTLYIFAYSMCTSSCIISVISRLLTILIQLKCYAYCCTIFLKGIMTRKSMHFQYRCKFFWRIDPSMIGSMNVDWQIKTHIHIHQREQEPFEATWDLCAGGVCHSCQHSACTILLILLFSVVCLCLQLFLALLF